MGEPWSGRQGSRQQRPGRPWHTHAHDVAAEAGLCRVITGKTRAVQGSNRVKILFTSVRSEADSPGQCNSVYVNTFLLKPWELVFCLYPPWRLVELVHTG